VTAEPAVVPEAERHRPDPVLMKCTAVSVLMAEPPLHHAEPVLHHPELEQHMPMAQPPLLRQMPAEPAVLPPFV
jgi:hypothetical protein